jgi:hypothetical protein
MRRTPGVRRGRRPHPPLVDRACAGPLPSRRCTWLQSRRVSRDLILATAEGYEWEAVQPFVESLRATGYEGDVCFFVSQVDENTCLHLVQAGIDIVRPRRLHLDARLHLASHERVAARLRWPPGSRFAVRAVASLTPDAPLSTARMAGAIAFPEIARYFWYFDHLKSLGPGVRNVMLTDARDVLFLGPPFNFEIGDSAHFFLESENVRLGDSSYNRSWLITAYGEEVLGNLAHRPISCSGVTIGPVRAVLEYLAVMTDQLARLPRHVRGIDQGVHNFVVHSGLIPDARLVPNREGPVLTVGKMSATQAMEALSEHQNDVNVVHQYDRHPELVEAVDVRSRPPHRRIVTRTRSPRLAGARRAVPLIVPPLAGIASVAVTAAAVELATDRDWAVRGMEWPTDFLAAAMLVLLVPIVLSMVRALTGRHRSQETFPEDRAPENET